MIKSSYWCSKKCVSVGIRLTCLTHQKNYIPKDKEMENRPLESAQRMFTLLCLYPADKNTKKLKKLAYVLLTSLIFISEIIVVTGSLLFFTKHVSTNLTLSLYGFFQLSSASMAYTFVAYTFLFLSKHKIITIFEKLTEIYYDCKSSMAKYLTSANSNRFLHLFLILKVEIKIHPGCWCE